MATFVILAVIVLLGAVAALAQRNLVHCALALVASLAGLAGLYLQLDAQFVGFAQVLVYIGAVAILIVFAILLTRGSEPPTGHVFSASWPAGVAVAAGVCTVICAVTLSSGSLGRTLPDAAGANVSRLGRELMGRYVLPLEVVGLLLTATLIGAVILAMHLETRRAEPSLPGGAEGAGNGREAAVQGRES